MLWRVSDQDVRHLGVVLRHADVAEILRPLRSFKAVEVVVDEGPCDLPCSVGTEVEHDHRVMVSYDALFSEGYRNEELVVGVSFVGSIDGSVRAFCGRAVSYGHGVISLLHALPSLVSVHRVVSSGYNADLSETDLFHVLFELIEINFRASGRDVSSVEEAVDVYGLNAFFLRHVQKGEEVRQVRVDSAVADEAVYMEGRAVLYDVVHRRIKSFVLKESAFFDLLRDARQFLVDDASCADVEVADLGVSHLSFGKPHVEPAGGKRRSGICFEYAVDVGFCGLGNSVARTVGCDAESVEYHQHRWSFEFFHTCTS